VLKLHEELIETFSKVNKNICNFLAKLAKIFEKSKKYRNIVKVCLNFANKI